MVGFPIPLHLVNLVVYFFLEMQDYIKLCCILNNGISMVYFIHATLTNGVNDSDKFPRTECGQCTPYDSVASTTPQ